jgi:hypothetical protein
MREPIVRIHGTTVDQGFLQMVESHVLAGTTFAHDGQVLSAPLDANRDALEIFERQPLTVALCLEWLSAHGRGGIRASQP